MERMILKLARNETGRVLIHVIVALNTINHFHKPNLGFLFAGVARYVKGIG